MKHDNFEYDFPSDTSASDMIKLFEEIDGSETVLELIRIANRHGFYIPKITLKKIEDD